jgi:hypothetical protein
MAWKCPGCGNQNDDVVSECSCGYSFLKILGVKTDSTKKEVKDAFKYLLKVWNPDRFSHDPQSQKKAEERLNEITAAYGIAKQILSDYSGTENRTVFIKIASFSVIIIILLVALFVFLKNDQKDKQQDQIIVQRSEEVSPQTSVPYQNDAQGSQEESVYQSPENFFEYREDGQKPQHKSEASLVENMTPEETEAKVIELVKQSNALDRFFPVEKVLKKWTDENSDELQLIGWLTKKIDDRIYLVSYTASDGLGTKGFYFEIDIKNGNVQHIGNNPELQKKYGIKYN